MRRRVLLVDPLHPDAVVELERTFELRMFMHPSEPVLRDLIRDVHVVVLRSGVHLTAEVIDAAVELEVIARAGVGTDNIDLTAARRRGIRVFHVPNVAADAVAEFTAGLVVAVARNIVRADRQLRAAVWDKAGLAGMELRGKTLGVVGLGEIGSRVARIMDGFGMSVIGVTRRQRSGVSSRFAGHDVELADLPTVLARADVLVLAVPLTADTAGLITGSELALMKPSAFLVNISRGGVVDEHDLYRALVSGAIAGAALDVLLIERSATPLANLDNVVLTPHIGAMTVDAQRRIGRTVVDSISAVLAGSPVPNLLC